MKNFIELTHARYNNLTLINVANITFINEEVRGECIIHTNDGLNIPVKETYNNVKDKINNAI
jgi:hypothetical protein